jgi:hydrogenase maturation protease
MTRVAGPAILLIGYGNELRGDDAIGPRVARAIGELRFPWLRVLMPQQLTPELADPIARAQAVVFVDATLNAPPGAIQMGPLAGAAMSEPLGHLSNPRSLLALAEAVFNRVPPAWMVTVGIEELCAKEGLSPKVEQAVPEVIEILRALLLQLAKRR